MILQACIFARCSYLALVTGLLWFLWVCNMKDETWDTKQEANIGWELGAGCTLGTCPSQHVLCVWLSASPSAFLSHSQSPGTIVAPLSRTIKPPLDGSGCISALISAVITFITKLPQICETRNVRQHRDNILMLPRMLVSQQFLLCPLAAPLTRIILIWSMFSQTLWRPWRNILTCLMSPDVSRCLAAVWLKSDHTHTCRQQTRMI